MRGPIPPELGNLTLLAEIALCNNQLAGLVPPELASQWRLGYDYVLSGNEQLTGSHPNARLVGYGSYPVDLCSD